MIKTKVHFFFMLVMMLSSSCTAQITRDSMYILFNNVHDPYIDLLRERTKKSGLWGSAFDEIVPGYFDTLVPYEVFYAGVYQRYNFVINVYTGKILKSIDINDVNKIFLNKRAINIDKCYIYILARNVIGMVTPYEHYRNRVQKGTIFKRNDKRFEIFDRRYTPKKYINIINKSTNDDIYMGVYTFENNVQVYNLFNFKFVKDKMVEAKLILQDKNPKEIFSIYIE